MPGLRKRKAPSPPVQQDDDRGDSGEERSESESEHDEDEPQEVEPQEEAPPASTGKRKGRQQARNKPLAPASTLLDAVKSQSSAVGPAAKGWADHYEADKTSATADLLTLLVQAGGAVYTISNTEVSAGEVDKLAQTLLKAVQQHGWADHFKAKGAKSFKANYLKLWDRVLKEGLDRDLLYDNYLLDQIVHLLTGLNISVVRSFRYAATITAGQVITSLIGASANLAAARETAQRQLAAEEKKKNAKTGVTAERIAAFKATVDRCHRRIGELKSIVGNIFQAVFTARFRDVSEDIRAAVIADIGTFISMEPSHYLQDNYLKYLAWAMSDKDAAVREAAVDALVTLYEEEDNVLPLHEFTARFRPRMGELIYDIDDSVAVKGVALLTALVKAEEISHKEVGEVFKLLVDGSASIRHAATELAADLLEGQGKHFLAAARVSPSKGRKRNQAATQEELQLAGLLQILHMLADFNKPVNGSSLPSGELVSRVVDALFGSVEVLGDWRLLARVLLDDKAGEQREEAATTHLVLLLQHAAEHACAVAPTAASDGRQVGGKAKAAAAAQKHRQELTLALMPSLPQLLRRHQTDSHRVGALAALARCLNLEVYALQKKDEDLKDLVQALVEQVPRHYTAAPLQQSLHSLALLASTEHAGQEHAQMALSGLSEKLAAGLGGCVQQLLQLSDTDLADMRAADSAESSPDDNDDEVDDEAYALRAALMRSYHLLLASQPAPASVNKDISKHAGALLEAARKGRRLPSSIIQAAVRLQALALAWSLLSVTDAATEDDDEDTAEEHPEAAHLGRAVQAFALQLQTLGEECGDDAALAEVAVRAQADLFMVFDASKLQGTGPEKAGLKLDAPRLQGWWQQCQVLLEWPAADTDADADAEAEDESAQAADPTAVQRKLAALNGFGRIALQQGQAVWVAHVASYLGSSQEQVGETAKEVCKRFKKAHPSAMVQVYAKALQLAFKRCDAGDSQQDSEAAYEPFHSLCHRVAAAHAGFVSNAGESLGAIVHDGINFVFGGFPEALPFLSGLAHIAGRLPGKQAQEALSQLESHTRAMDVSEAGEAWDVHLSFQQALQERLGKARGVKSALRKPKGTGSAAKRGPKRRISFRDLEASDGDEEDEEPEAIEEPDNDDDDEGEPAPSAAAKRVAPPPQRATTRQAAGAARKTAAAQQAEEIEDVVDSEEESEAEDDRCNRVSAAAKPGRRSKSGRLAPSASPAARKGKTVPGASPTRSRISSQEDDDLPPPHLPDLPASDEDEPAPEAEEADEGQPVPTEEQLPGVGNPQSPNDAGSPLSSHGGVPTEEQMPVSRPANKKRKRPQRQLRRLYDDTQDSQPEAGGVDEDGKTAADRAAEAAREAEDDELLEPAFRTSPRRPAGSAGRSAPSQVSEPAPRRRRMA